MRETLKLMCIVAVLVATSGPLAAGTILNPAGGGSAQIQAFEPIGNSFTAEDPQVTAALWLVVMNASFDPTEPIQFELYDGVGAGGALLFSDSVVVVAGSTGFYDVDLRSVPLVVGNDYSFVASIAGTSPYWGVAASTSGSIGTGITKGAAANVRYALRVNPIPEPAALATLALGGLAMAFAAVRYRRKASRRR